MSQTAVPDAGSPGLRLSSARGRWVVTTTVLGSGMAALDATVVGIALPAIGRDFHASVSSLQWVVDAYTLTLAGLLLLGGTLGDSYGRRKMFVVGTVWFAIASLLCGLAPNVAVLIAARALQGVGGALLTPGSLAILQASFAEDDRGAAIGAWSGLGGVATAFGPFVGGWLISAVSWRLVFFINLPLAVAVVVIAARHVPETKSPGPVPKLDIKGAACISGALAGITYGLIAASSYGWGSVSVLLPLAAGAVLLGLFILVEAKEPQPMLPLGLFSVPAVLRGQRGDVRGLRGAGRAAVPGPHRAAGGPRLQPGGVGHGPAAGDVHHARAVLPVREAGRQDRAAAADVGGAAGDRRVAALVRQARRVWRLPDRRCCPRRWCSGSGWRSWWRR